MPLARAQILLRQILATQDNRSFVRFIPFVQTRNERHRANLSTVATYAVKHRREMSDPTFARLAVHSLFLGPECLSPSHLLDQKAFLGPEPPQPVQVQQMIICWTCLYPTGRFVGPIATPGLPVQAHKLLGGNLPKRRRFASQASWHDTLHTRSLQMRRVSPSGVGARRVTTASAGMARGAPRKAFRPMPGAAIRAKSSKIGSGRKGSGKRGPGSS
jgi:hypothetical protein